MNASTTLVRVLKGAHAHAIRVARRSRNVRADLNAAAQDGRSVRVVIDSGGGGARGEPVVVPAGVEVRAAFT